MAETSRPVALPTRWHVDQQDGTQPYSDEPDALVPAGTYLIGCTDSDDPETAWTVCLRAEYAVDAGSEGGVEQRNVVQAIADRLNADQAHPSVARSEHPTQQRARVYAALHDQRLVRTGVLGRTRALDAPEMQRIAAIAVEALRPGATP